MKGRSGRWIGRSGPISCPSTSTDSIHITGLLHSLDEDDLGVLEAELQKLLERGYGWNHPHTQCILQGLLYDFQTG
ncbi:unnamed protein product [Nezara viridula]|uniref:Uncharacterized protein n=1 Tax=Nezara viridula TaxID=85310 RepID=A0A9P0MUH5_NEZVI|nr:unnamed protein product [Nezara viridula]